MSLDDHLSIIAVMRTKEDVEYSYRSIGTRGGSSSSCVRRPGSHIDCESRRLMVDWCYKVVDRCGFRRETVAFAISYLDRYVAAHSATLGKKQFQLASMTAMYIAIKVNESEAMHPRTIEQLSRGVYTEKDVERMEIDILFTLKWKCHPPTARAFIQHLCHLIPDECLGDQQRDRVLQMAQLQADLALMDFSLVTQAKPSSIAYCAIANAIDICCCDHQERNKDTGFMAILTNFAAIVEPNKKAIRRKLRTSLAVKQNSFVPNEEGGGGVEKRSTTSHLSEKDVRQRLSSSPRDVRSLSTS